MSRWVLGVCLSIGMLSGCAGVNNRQLTKIGYSKDNLAYFSGDGGVVLYKRTLTTQVHVESPCLFYNTRTGKALTRLFDCGDQSPVVDDLQALAVQMNAVGLEQERAGDLVAAVFGNDTTKRTTNLDLLNKAVEAAGQHVVQQEPKSKEEPSNGALEGRPGDATSSEDESDLSENGAPKQLASTNAKHDGPWVLLPIPAGDYFADRNLDGKIGRFKDALFARRFDDGLVCVMPPVQAARTSEAAGGGSGKVSADVAAGGGSGEGSGYGASAIGVQQLFEHSQSAWFLQVALYRLCEARLNGMIDEEQYHGLYVKVFESTVQRLGDEFVSQESVAKSEAALQAAASTLNAAKEDLAKATTDAQRTAILADIASIRQKLDTRILASVLGEEIPEGELDEADALEQVLNIEYQAKKKDAADGGTSGTAVATPAPKPE